jgi:hypothetical protein
MVIDTRPAISLIFGSFGVSLARPVNGTFPSLFRTDALADSETYVSTVGVDSEVPPSRSFHVASALAARAWSSRFSLRQWRCLSPVCTFLAQRLSTRPSSFQARTPHSVASQPRTPNHALQRTAPVGHAACSPQSLPRRQRARPPLSLSLESFGDATRSLY